MQPRSRHRLPRIVLAVTLAFTAAATAQPDDQTSRTPVPTKPVPRQQALWPDPVSIDFAGGTVAEFIEALRRASGPDRPINVLLPQAAGALRVPPITLAKVSVETAMRLMTEAVSQERGPTEKFAMERVPDQGSPSLTFQFTYYKGVAGLPRAPRYTRVHALRTLVDPPEGLQHVQGTSIPVETIMGAIETAVKIAGEDDTAGIPPDLMLHRDSLILVCRGSESQLDAVRGVLAELRSGIEPTRASLLARAAADRDAKLAAITADAEITQARLQLERADAEFQAATKRVEQAVKLPNSVSRTELDRLEAAVVTARTIRDQAASMVNMLDARAAVQRSAAQDSSARPDTRLIIYDIRDFGPFMGEIEFLTRQLADADGGAGRLQTHNNTLIVTTTRPRHDQISALLRTLRRVKANDPNLEPPTDDKTFPGLEDQIKR